MSIERTDIAVSDHQARVTRALDVSAPSVPEIGHVMTMAPTKPFTCTCTCGWLTSPGTRHLADAAIEQHQHFPRNGANP